MKEKKFEEVKISQSGCMCVCTCAQQEQVQEGENVGKEKGGRGAGEEGNSNSRSRKRGIAGGRREWWMPSVRQKKSESRNRSTGGKQSKRGGLSEL